MLIARSYVDIRNVKCNLVDKAFLSFRNVEDI